MTTREAPSQKSKNQRGQATIEYVFLLGFAVSVAGYIASVLMGRLDGKVLELGGTLEKQLKTGRSPVSIWRN